MQKLHSSYAKTTFYICKNYILHMQKLHSTSAKTGNRTLAINWNFSVKCILTYLNRGVVKLDKTPVLMGLEGQPLLVQHEDEFLLLNLYFSMILLI